MNNLFENFKKCWWIFAILMFTLAASAPATFILIRDKTNPNYFLIVNSDGTINTRSSVQNPVLYDQNVTNMPASTFTLTITNVSAGSYTWGRAGVSNVINVPSRLTNCGVQLYAVTYNRHTNTAFNAEWIITTNPIYWNTLGLQAYITNSDAVYQIGKIYINTDTNDITGFTKSITTNQLITLPPGQLYFYMKYKSTSVNAGGTPTDTMVLHFYNN